MIALLLNHLWQSSLCVGGAGLLTLTLRRYGASARFWLWFAASVKFLVPFALLTALGAALLTPMLPPVAAPAMILIKPLAQPFPALSLAAPPASATAPMAAPSFAARPPTTAPAVSAAAHLDLGSALLALWIAGFLIIALRWLVRWWRVRALLRDATTLQVDAPIAVKLSASRLEPGLVGILRPVILLPRGIEQQLSAVEIKAVLAHELCHWRRHDNLLAAIHMLVEALFWFFPLVWWLGARLNAERECACDESVLAAGNDPQMYAEGILKVCRVYLQSPLACVAGVSGAGLKKRIDGIMENRLILQLNAARKFVLGTSAAAALVLPLMLGLAAVPVLQRQAKAVPNVQTNARATPSPVLNERERQVNMSLNFKRNLKAFSSSFPIAYNGGWRHWDMPRKTVQIFAVSALLTAGGMQASAETAAPSETVTVTAARSREVFHKFARAFINPTRFTEKIARWERRICPVTIGQDPHFNAFITQRVQYVALAAGARINTEASCAPNIKIVFTATPQALLDDVRQHQPDFLGYADTSSQREKMATVTRPIQAWYTTESIDLKGRRRVDSASRLDNGGGTSSFNGDINSDPNGNGFYQTEGLKGLPAYAVTGDRTTDGLHAGFNHILIVIDSTKLAGQNIVPLADYISVLALTQLNSLDACQQLPSIVNKLAAACDQGVDGLTQYDLAYLQGLYNMNIDRKLMFQENDIASIMADKLPRQIMASALK